MLIKAVVLIEIKMQAQGIAADVTAMRKHTFSALGENAYLNRGRALPTHDRRINKAAVYSKIKRIVSITFPKRKFPQNVSCYSCTDDSMKILSGHCILYAHLISLILKNHSFCFLAENKEIKFIITGNGIKSY